MKYIFSILILFLSLYCHSQSGPDTSKPVYSKVYQVVEQMPEYPGGETAMMKFIQNNIVYPKYARKHNIEGRVVVGFIINEDGTLSDIEVKKSVNPEIDAEAVKVVSALPRFKPGRQQGKNVRVKFVLPIMFRLSK